VSDAPYDLHGFRSPEAAAALVERIRALATEPIALMEVCGTHTVAISRFGLRSMLPGTVRLLSGPGCPVCVTPLVEIDRAIAAARIPGVTIATFGDMMRVPGSRSSLEAERARGADVSIVYSPAEALALAAEDSERKVVFLGVGFETTSPAIAATIVEADRRDVRNFLVLPFFKRVPPALEELARVPGRRLDGFICPGHVSVVIGAAAYEPIAHRHGIPCAVAGFEPLDILAAVAALAKQARGRSEGRPARVENLYRRAVTTRGNRRAQEVIDEVYVIGDAEWRGIGTIPGSGYAIRERYAAHDARAALDIDVPAPREPAGCICGEIMLGLKLPGDCPLFGTRCTPRDPVGPCMVSSEGSCAAFHRYERVEAVRGAMDREDR